MLLYLFPNNFMPFDSYAQDPGAWHTEGTLTMKKVKTGHMPACQALRLCSLGRFLPVTPLDPEGPGDGAASQDLPQEAWLGQHVCRTTMPSHRASHGGCRAWQQGSHLQAPRSWGERPCGRRALTPSTLIDPTSCRGEIKSSTM